jgi:hypothetical protein
MPTNRFNAGVVVLTLRLVRAPSLVGKNRLAGKIVKNMTSCAEDCGITICEARLFPWYRSRLPMLALPLTKDSVRRKRHFRNAAYSHDANGKPQER